MTKTSMIYRVYLDGEITEESARDAIQELREIDTEDPTATIEYTINSLGGSMYDGTAIFSELRSMSKRGGGSHPLVTVARGMVGSVTSLIYQAGDERVGGELDIFLMHEPALSHDGMYVTEVQQRVYAANEWVRKYIDVMMERAAVEREFLEELVGPCDRIVSMEEAIEYGLADRIG